MQIIYIIMLGCLLIGCQQRNHEGDISSSLPHNEFKVTSKRYRAPAPMAEEQEYQEENQDRHTIRRAHHRPHPVFRQTKQDGAPAGPLPVHFRKVVPKYEPISHYGNPDEYEVMGQKYHVMTNSTGYKTRGIASWYGTKFHAGRTSSGEKYDMYALTAAHKTLPLPTYLRVTNLENGHSAVVKVNDRGPFHESRILDLSYAAAAKIGLFPKGTAKVEIEALTSTQHSLNYYVQAGAFESVGLAEQLRSQLTTLSTSPVYVQQYKGRYLVQVGPLANKRMVDDLKDRLNRHGIHGSFSVLM